MRIFGYGCEHDWEMIDKVVGESAFEQAKRLGVAVNGSGDDAFALFCKRVSRVFKCSKCGKVWVQEGRI